jgi:hypothetical protein
MGISLDDGHKQTSRERLNEQLVAREQLLKGHYHEPLDAPTTEQNVQQRINLLLPSPKAINETQRMLKS